MDGWMEFFNFFFSALTLALFCALCPLGVASLPDTQNFGYKRYLLVSSIPKLPLYHGIWLL